MADGRKPHGMREDGENEEQKETESQEDRQEINEAQELVQLQLKPSYQSEQ